MNAHTVFWIIIGIIALNFVKDAVISYLNAQKFNDTLPTSVADIYNKEEYLKSQDYKKENYNFSRISNTFSLLLTLSFFFANGFYWLDEKINIFTDNSLLQSLTYIAVLVFANDILSLPLAYYHTFVIEEKYGFNKSTKKLFFIDKIKSWMLSICIGLPILALITWFYEKTGELFWLYTWLFVGGVTLFLNLFYSSLIAPIFNKQTPLEEGELKTALENLGKSNGFSATETFVIDGSKRSTKANAYFSGFGPKKRIVLYDTLIEKLTTDEIVAVFAHELGHYKKKHTLYNLFASILTTGFTLYILSLLINNPLLANALKISEPSFHIGLIVFSILFSPISELTGLVMNIISRKFEYQADDFAKKQSNAEDLISALKKLSKDSLSNLTPHYAMVFMHYSHPTLVQRIENLRK